MKSKVVYVCSECGYESAKWIGKCPGCGGWNTFAEDVVVTSKSSKKVAQSFSVPVKLSTVDTTKDPRIVCGIGELDRVLGGGIVRGSLVLVGGEPGIGKSTILLQLIKSLEENTTFFYVSGEESEKQLKMRADRLGIQQDFYVLTETDINAAIKHAETIAPDILIIDSIQTMYNPDIASAPGTVSQVRDVTLSLMKLAKERSISVFVVGHVTKDGALAGPKVLEHMVDCVLYFEGERHQSHRILRAVKNRFGSTNEIGVFEMTGEGLREVKNPSSMMLEGRPEKTSGSTVICTLEGTRPLLAEVQSLVAPTTFPAPRRMTTGADYNRVNLLIAVLEKRVGLNLSNQDIYVNIVGGMRIDEPAADLGIICAVASAFKNKDIDPEIALIGEVGLTGELRAVNQIDKRLNEMKKLGFSMHFESANGTDLTVGLAEQAVWESAGSKNEKGVPFLPNIPTEEVFTAPHKDKVDGIVYGTKPYVFNGQLIKNFHVTFKDGKVVEHGADEGADLLGQLLDTDEGARHIGEVALVPASSPINRSGKLFYNTLFDENAACHIAFGDSYPGTTVGGTGLSKEELAARGMNHSSLHEDVMVGAEDSRITGKCRDGRTVQLFENGVWVL